MATPRRPSSEHRNLQIVLTAFDTLFNKRDYASAERFWSPNYIQHSAHIPPGREGLFGLIKPMPATLRYENHIAAATGDFVPLHPVKQKSGKVVHAFAVEADFTAQAFTSNQFDMEWPPRSGQWKSFPEIDQLAWFAVPQALSKIIAYQQPFLIELQRILGGRVAATPQSH